MEHFNVPMLSESSYASTSTHHHKDHMLAAGNSPSTPFISYTLDGSKDGGSTPNVTTSPAGIMKSDYAEFTNCIQQSALLDHRNVVDANMDSLSGLCDLKFPSPNPHVVSEASIRGLSLLNSLEPKTLQSIAAASGITTAATIAATAANMNTMHAVGHSNGPMTSVPSFTNLLFESRSDSLSIDPKLTQTNCHHTAHLVNRMPTQADPQATTAASNVTQYHTLKLVEMDLPRSPSGFLVTSVDAVNSTTARATAAGCESNAVSFNIASTTISKVNNSNNSNNNSSSSSNNNNDIDIKLHDVNIGYNLTAIDGFQQRSIACASNSPIEMQDLKHDAGNQLDNSHITTTTTTTIATPATKTIKIHHMTNNTADNEHNKRNSNSNRSSSSSNNGSGSGNSNSSNSNASNSNGNQTNMQNNKDLAASSCSSMSIATVPNISKSNSNNNNNNVNSGPQPHHYPHQHQHSQHHISNNSKSQQSRSNASSDCESLTSQEDHELIIDERSGYQDTTSSHSQQSGGGGGGGGGGTSLNAQLLNGTGGGGGGGIGGSSGNAAAGGYMSLLPPAGSAAAHLGGAGVAGSGGTSATSGVPGEAIDFKHLFEELCPVCGDKVSGYHYGLLTCESCKGFFKRTVQNKKVYTCVAERSCHIDKTQRKRCPYCRFQKCLEVGMKLEAVRADRMRGGRNKFGPMYKRDRARKLQVMRQRQLALQALRTTMGSTEMKPTPLSPGYQQAYPNMNIKQEIQIPQVSSLTQSPDSSPSPIAIALGQVNAAAGVIATPINGAGASSAGGGGGNGGGTGGGGGGGGGSSGGGSGGGGGGGNNNNSNNNDIINRGSGSSSCHDTGTGSLQNIAESKLCFDSGTHPSSTADSLIEPLRVSPMIRDFVQSIDDREWQTQLFALLQKQTYNQVEVDLFELMCKVLDQNLFSQVDWARNTVFFKDLKVDDQMKLLQHSWSDMLVLDHLHHRIHNGLPDETQLNNGQVFNLLSLGLLGVPQLADYFNELQSKLQDLKFDMGDYVCMKFLILLNPEVRGIINKKTVLEGHENVQAALLDYTLTCYPSVTDKFRRLLNILPEIHAMAARGEEHLYSKHCAGSAPTQTLLMEMLHAKRKV